MCLPSDYLWKGYQLTWTDVVACRVIAVCISYLPQEDIIQMAYLFKSQGLVLIAENYEINFQFQ